MPLPRTKTMGMQDLVLSGVFPSATADGASLIWVSPIDGWVERVLCVRGGTHSAPEIYGITIGANSQLVVTGANGGAAGDVDQFELGANGSDSSVAAGGLINIVISGDPAGATPIGVFLVVRRR